MLTARGEEGDRVRGLDTGADDYVTKPFSPDASCSRACAPCCAASARRWPTRRCSFADIVDGPRRAPRARATASAVHLGPTEFRLLRHLHAASRAASSRREQLLDAVWGPDVYVEPRTVDVHIRRLRKALNADGDTDLIRTVRAAGYALDATPGLTIARFPHRQSRFCSLGRLHPACPFPPGNPTPRSGMGRFPRHGLTPRRRSYCPSFLAEGGVSFSKCRRTITASTRAGRPSSAV